MTILNIIVSFLGGGIVGAVLNILHSIKSQKKEKKIQFIDKQIRNLYGPLYYFTIQIDKLFEINSKFHDAYDAHYVKKEYSLEKYTQEILKEETEVTINIANQYIRKVEENNKKIIEILDNNYSYMDPDDIEFFATFYEHFIRLIIERDEEGRFKTPFFIYQNVGEVYLHPKEFSDRIRQKFLTKKKDFDKLLS